MGAVLVCFGDHDQGAFRTIAEKVFHIDTFWADFETLQRRGRAPSEDSLLDRFQKSWSCGRLEDEDEDPVNWDEFLLQSTKSTASSGSRMLSVFYSRLLEENDDCAFFVDCRGKRLKGANLDQVELLENYFHASGRRRSDEYPSPIESLEIYCSSEDCFSTSSTLISELDYWASSDPLFTDERHYRPAFGRSSSFSSPDHTGLKIHRAQSSPYKLFQEHLELRSPSSPRSKMDRQFPSPKPYMPSMGLSTLSAAS
ncbi:hypothetical protein PHMEG_0007083 [Phytophthora megakarya]|uniref:Uncharacterized protein n=1 Tax=Phytophthora megakarya TaxID=4795 RepID=A0A225WPK4_9STRA|nr:hypothetical protein PHMEG_0007083 [Phytophthora megakarya]